jgi:hypothetical protein
MASVGNEEWGIGNWELGIGSGGDELISNAQCPMPNV